jgi:hypothetical protein
VFDGTQVPQGQQNSVLMNDVQMGSRRYEWIIFLLFLVSLPLVNPWVRGDGIGYYAYARAPLIEHSLDFTHDYQSGNQGFRDGRIDASGQPVDRLRTRTGHLDNHFTVGPAILWAPFLLVAHFLVLLARALGSGVAADGFSAPYRYAMAVGTCVYGFLALLLSYRLARKYTAPVWAFLACAAIWWASSLPVYMYFNPSWSHAHSAFAVVLFLWYWDKTRAKRSLRQWLLLALISGLMLNVYYANLMVVSVLVVEAVQQYASILERKQRSERRALDLMKCHVLFALVVCLSLLPTFYTRLVVYGGPFETGYLKLSALRWSSPALVQVLFSANHGLLSWTPLLAISILGIVLLARTTPEVGVPLVVASVAFYLLLTVYPDWAGISSYGNRFFVSLTGIFIVGLGVALERFAKIFPRQRIAVAMISSILGVFVLWNLGLIYQWGAHLIPARGAISFREAAYNQVFVVPRQLTSQLRAYVFRRSDLMRQIEQRDLEQLKKESNPQRTP